MGNSLLFPELFEDRVKIDYFVKKTVDYVEYQSSSGGKDNNDKMWSFPNYEAIYNTNGNKLLWWDHVKDWPDLTSDQKMKSNPFINHNKNAKNLKIMQANGNLIKERADKDRQIYAYNQNKLSDEERKGSRGNNLKSFIKKWQITEEEMKNGKIGIVVGDNGEACAVKLPDRVTFAENMDEFKRNTHQSNPSIKRFPPKLHQPIPFDDTELYHRNILIQKYYNYPVTRSTIEEAITQYQVSRDCYSLYLKLPEELEFGNARKSDDLGEKLRIHPERKKFARVRWDGYLSKMHSLKGKISSKS